MRKGIKLLPLLLVTVMVISSLTGCSFNVGTSATLGGTPVDEVVSELNIDNADEVVSVLEQFGMEKVKSNSKKVANGKGTAKLSSKDDTYVLVIEDGRVTAINDADGIEIYSFTSTSNADTIPVDESKPAPAPETVPVDNNTVTSVGDNSIGEAPADTSSDSYVADFVTGTYVGNNKVQLTPVNKLQYMTFDCGVRASDFKELIEQVLDNSDWHDGYSINNNMYWQIAECLALKNRPDDEIADCMVIAACFAYESDDWMRQYPDTNTFDTAIVDFNDMTYHIYYGANDLEFNSNTRTAKLNGTEATWVSYYLDSFIKSARELLGTGTVASTPSTQQPVAHDGEYYIKQISGPHITGYEKYIADKIESVCGSRIVSVDTQKVQPGVVNNNYFYHVYLEDGSKVQLLECVDSPAHLEVYKQGSESNTKIIGIDDKVVNK